jgi:hypothetical protein
MPRLCPSGKQYGHDDGVREIPSRTTWGRYQPGGAPEVVARLKAIKVDPKLVTLAK